jgi:hypothetical protein
VNAFSDKDGMGSLLQYSETPAMMKSFAWVAQISIKSIATDTLEVDTVEFQTNSVQKINAKLIGSEYTPTGSLF